jgi:predicted PurR-regulated permease PerM
MSAHATPTKPQRQNDSKVLRNVLAIGGAAIVIGLLPFISGLVGALILYVIARPAHDRLARRIPARAAALFIALGVLTLLVLAGAWLAATIVSEGQGALRNWRPDALVAWLQQTPLRVFDVSSEVSNIGGSMFGWFSGRAFRFVGSAAMTTINIAIGFFGLYYLLLDGPELWSRVKRVLPLDARISDLLATRFVDVTEALLLGIVLTAALQGTLVGIAFAIVGLAPAVLWGFVTACVSVLPLFGSALVWLPGTIALLIDHRPGAALFMMIIGAGVASNLDNLLRPLVYRRISGIHPMLTFVGAFAGVHLFGLVGALLGPLILSYFFEFVRAYEAESGLREPARDSPMEVLHP